MLESAFEAAESFRNASTSIHKSFTPRYDLLNGFGSMECILGMLAS